MDLRRLGLASKPVVVVPNQSKLDGAKDPGITFEELGVDYVFVDEAHAYKNLRTTSTIPGMSVDGSQRASDLHMKPEYLRGKRDRVATLTGTNVQVRAVALHHLDCPARRSSSGR